MRAEGQGRTVVLGLGYIGLPTAALIARSGGQVIGVDVNADVVETINAGRIHIEEADLDGLVQAMVHRGLLRATTQVEAADTFLIAVPTPLTADHRPDIGHVLDAARQIAPVLQPGNLIILESTSPVGTTAQMRDILAQLRPDLRWPGATDGPADIFIAYCPERVLPGRILAELVGNDRCIGGITPRCARRAMRFYRRFVRGDCHTTSAAVGEMVKLVENSFRDVNIAFANELSMVAERLDVPVWEVIRLANRHPRVQILQPGPGVGGHCIAVDPWFLIHGAPEDTPLIRTARAVNHRKTAHVIARATRLIDGHPDALVGIFGLAFKPDIDDFRESPALDIALSLARDFGPRLHIVEPYAPGLPAAFDGTGACLTDLDDALGRCDLWILLVDHELFRSIPASERGGKVIYDTRGIWGDQTRRVRAADVPQAEG